MRLNRLAAAAAVVVLSTGLLAACGGDDDSSGSGSSSAPAKAGDELTQESFAQSIADAMSGEGSSHVVLTSTGGLPINAEGDQVIGADTADSKMSMTMDVAGQEIEMRLVDGVVYFKMPALTQDKFAEIDLSDTDNPLVEQFGGLAEQVDISEQIAGFGDAITGFEKTDAGEKLDGVDTTAYDVTVDAKKVLEKQGQEAVAGMPESFTYTFFIGDDNLVRRMTVDVMGQGIQMDFTDWGKDVTVEAPGADEISDVDLSQLGQMAG